MESSGRFYLFPFATSGNVEQFALHELHCAVTSTLKINQEEDGGGGHAGFQPLYSGFAPERNSEQHNAIGEPKVFSEFLQAISDVSPMPLRAHKEHELEAKGCRRSASTVAHANDLHFPAVLVMLPSDRVAKAVASRCCLIKGVYKPFEIQESVESVVAHLTKKEEEKKAKENENFFLHSITEYQKNSDSGSAEADSSSSSRSFRYDVESLGKKVPQADKIALMQQCQAVNHEGKVDLKSPDLQFVLFLFHQKQHRTLIHVVHALELALSNRSLYLEKYSLKTRAYIGTTSMPPELCFTMCNLAQVQPCDLVYDPFCGTGSTCVAATHFGAHCMGTDMDGRVLRAGTPRDIKTKQVQKDMYKAAGNLDPNRAKSGVQNQSVPSEEKGREAEKTDVVPYGSAVDGGAPTMWTNFALYQLPSSPDRIRMNFSCWSQMWRPLVRGRRRENDHQVTQTADADSGFIDAIMCDPPYGVREQKRKVDGDKIGAGEGQDGKPTMGTSIAGSSSAQEYATPEMLIDLILFAAESLKVGGRLVYWHPTDRRYTDSEIPKHPKLRLLYSIEQLLTLKTSRWLVVMEKMEACCPGSVPRDMCRPERDAANLRTMMDDTGVQGEQLQNADYAAYREKVERSRIANAKFNSRAKGESTAPGEDGEVDGETGVEFNRKLTKAERRGGKTRADQKAETMRNRVNNQVFLQRKAMHTELVNKGSKRRTAEETAALMALDTVKVTTVANARDGSGFCRLNVQYGKVEKKE